MDDDLAKAIALSLQSAESESNREERDLQRALELSRQSASQLPASQSDQAKPSYDSQIINNIPATHTSLSDSNSSGIVEILSSDDEEMDPDLKMAIELSKTAHSDNKENLSSTGLNSGFGNSQNIIDEDMKLAIQLQK